MTVLALLRILLDPTAACRAAAIITGQPELADELVAISYRESRHQLVGVHLADARWSSYAYRRAVKVGWIDPSCPFHQPGPGWATRGILGLFASYSLRYLGCVPRQLLDVPFVSALAAALKARDLCKRRGACDHESRRRFWAGGEA
jgi:hypothetical protein